MQSLTRVVVPMALAAALLSPAVRAKEARVRHVLLISVDGLHQRDLARFIADHPASALSRLSRSGVTWDDARATTPSDSFPGLLALVTGGTPKSTGVYYDDSYDRTLYPPGSNCQGAAGSEIVYDESDDFDMDRLFSGGINPKNLPLQKDASGCHPLYPHSFLRVNTIFEVAKAAGLRTAWSDKHPSYDLVNGPSGNGVDDLYTPEIAEHGGGAPDDTHVALLISVAGVEERHVAAPVETTQVAPTILRALGLDPRELQAVREEHTKLLTGAPF